MNTERATRAALAAAAAFAVGYLLPGTLQLPVPIYDPARHLWSIARTAPGVSMRYYGDLLSASLAALAAAGLVWKLQPRRTPLPLAAAAAMSLVALDVLYYLSRLLAAR